MDLDSVENSVHGIRIFSHKLLSLFPRISFDDDQAADLIRQGAGQHDPTLAAPTLYSFDMSRAINFSLGLTIRAIKPENDKFHGKVS